MGNSKRRLMWIQKLPAEISLERRATLLRVAGLNVLLGLCLWYSFVRLSVFFGLLPRNSVSIFIGCAVVAVLLPTAWHATSRARRQSERTTVCDRCNVVKTADDQRTCKCGGH